MIERRMRLGSAIMVMLAALTMTARADEDKDLRARQLYELGRAAYNKADYQTAYDSFKESFSLSHKPALLYNVASALQALKRPHDAAETLRSYLRLVPDDPDKGQIEERVRTLEEEQRLLDIDRREREPRPAPVEPTPQPVTAPGPSAPAQMTPPKETAAPGETAPSLTLAQPRADEAAARRHRRNVILGVTLGTIAAVGLAVGLGVGLGTGGGSQPLTQSTIGPIAGTR
jgi:tetratricopeptide (TPR) repeat protein